MKKLKGFYPIMIIVSGLCAGLSVILPDAFGFLAWIALSPAIFVMMSLCREKTKARGLYGMGLLYFISYYVMDFHWFTYLYPLDFTGLDNFASVLVIIVAWFGLSLFQALGSALIFLIYGLFSTVGAFRRCPIAEILAFPLIYAIFEYSQTLGWWGVPWARLCLSQMGNLPIVSTSSLFGSYTVTALIVLVNSVIAFLAIHKDKVKLRRIASAIAIICFSANLFIGGIIYSASCNAFDRSEKITVAAIQGNFSSTDKWSASADETYERYESYTRLAAADGADIILWPETALPYNLHDGTIISGRLERLARELDVTLVVGALSYEDGNLYNRLNNISPDEGMKDVYYNKRHLVPFGEYVPMRKLMETFLPFLSDISILDEDMTPGMDPSVMDINGVGAGCLICFDSIYESLAIDSVRAGAELFLLSTNDSWFYDSVAISMHNDQARLRSIETGRCTLRAANTGVSTVITYSGDVTRELKPLVEGYVVGEVSPSTHRTLYSYVGNTFIYLSAAALAGYFIFEAVREKKERSEGKKSGTEG